MILVVILMILAVFQFVTGAGVIMIKGLMMIIITTDDDAGPVIGHGPRCHTIHLQVQSAEM